jgi:hypothetical protein
VDARVDPVSTILLSSDGLNEGGSKLKQSEKKIVSYYRIGHHGKMEMDSPIGERERKKISSLVAPLRDKPPWS